MDIDQFVAKWGRVNEVCEHLIENPDLGEHCTEGYDTFQDDGPYPDLDPTCGDGWCDGKGWRKEVDWAWLDEVLEVAGWGPPKDNRAPLCNCPSWPDGPHRHKKVI